MRSKEEIAEYQKKYAEKHREEKRANDNQGEPDWDSEGTAKSSSSNQGEK